MNILSPRAINRRPRSRNLHMWLTVLSVFMVATSGSGCGKQEANESHEPAPPAALTAPAEEPAAVESLTVDLDIAGATAAGAVADSPAAEADVSNDPAASQEWVPDEELAKKLAAVPFDLGRYSIRLPEGFIAVGRSGDAAKPEEAYLAAFTSPDKVGTMSVTIYPPKEEVPERDAMLAGFFANVSLRWPDSQRQETEHGTINGMAASRAFYEAKVTAALTIEGVIYLLDHGDQRILIQGAANRGTSAYSIELIDAAIKTLAPRQQE